VELVNDVLQIPSILQKICEVIKALTQRYNNDLTRSKMLQEGFWMLASLIFILDHHQTGTEIFLKEDMIQMKEELENIININWEYLCMNQSKEAIDLLMQYPENIDWMTLSSNPYAIDLLRQNPDKIDYWGLCWNPYAIDIIEASNVS
jgi:hypothetical protein